MPNRFPTKLVAPTMRMNYVKSREKDEQIKHILSSVIHTSQSMLCTRTRHIIMYTGRWGFGNNKLLVSAYIIL